MNKRGWVKLGVLIGIAVFLADMAYRIYNNLNYLSREKCFMYQHLPRPLFLFLEYFVELFLIILLGVFIAVILERAYLRYKKFYPKNQVQAFVYGSLIPVCSCGAIPLLGAFKDKVKLRTVITFIVATPLLSPYIIMLSFTVLGLKFTVFRIIASFILAISSGYVIEFFVTKRKLVLPDVHKCSKFLEEKDLYLKTYFIMKQIFPYFLIAGLLGVAMEYIPLKEALSAVNVSNPYFGPIIAVLIGIPLYLCNGAEVLILRPLVIHMGIPLGTSIAFSMTSTAICVTSAVLLTKYLGKKLTYILILNIFIMSVAMGMLMNLLA